MEVVKAPNGTLCILLSKEEQKMLMQTLMGGVQEEIKFDDNLTDDPLKGFHTNTKKAIIELINKYKSEPFTGSQMLEVRKKYYVPEIQQSFRKIVDKGLMTIERKTDKLNIYQFSQKLCRHFGN
jgi:chemotaxis protein CheY-P-specific phosphatase CheC